MAQTVSRNRQDLVRALSTITSELLKEKGYISFVDIFMRLGYLSLSDYENWRMKRVSPLERVLRVNLSRINFIMKTVRRNSLNGHLKLSESRLVQVLKDQVAETPHIRLECHGSPYYQNTVLYPLTNLLQHTLQWQQDGTPEQRLEKLEQTLSADRFPLQEAVPLLTILLSLPVPEDRYPPLQLAPQRQRQKTLKTLLTLLFAQADHHPVLFIVEDLHWTDPTTLEWLTLLLEQVPMVSLLAVLTNRPEFESPWGLRSPLTSIALNPFTQSQIQTLVGHVTEGKVLPAEVMQHLVEQTDGVPLFIEEMTKAILESGALHARDGHYELTGSLTSLAIPMSLRDSLMARLDRLGSAKEIAQLGAILGRTFSYVLLQAVSALDDLVLWRGLVKLVEAELLEWGHASLRHALFVLGELTSARVHLEQATASMTPSSITPAARSHSLVWPAAPGSGSVPRG